MAAFVELKCDDEKIGGAKIDEGAYIEAVTEIRDYTDEIGGEDEQDELVKADHFPASGLGIFFPETGKDDVFIKRPGCENQLVAQKGIEFWLKSQIMNGYG
jgi:hypothetical protein